MQLTQIDVTGCRIVGAINRQLSHAGPKHHGIVLGRSQSDNHVYIAESMNFGYQLCTYDNFYQRYASNGDIIIQPNEGKLENLSVAYRALEEIKAGGSGKYHLVTNNCECFVNRSMHGKSVSNQVINTAIGVVALAGLVYVLKNSK